MKNQVPENHYLKNRPKQVKRLWCSEVQTIEEPP